MSENFEYFQNKRADRVYLGKSLSQKLFRTIDAGEVEELERPFRIVIDSGGLGDGSQIDERLYVVDNSRQSRLDKLYFVLLSY